MQKKIVQPGEGDGRSITYSYAEQLSAFYEKRVDGIREKADASTIRRGSLKASSRGVRANTIADHDSTENGRRLAQVGLALRGANPYSGGATGILLEIRAAQVKGSKFGTAL